MGHQLPRSFARYSFEDLVTGWVRGRAQIEEDPLPLVVVGGPACRWFPLPTPPETPPGYLIDGQLSLAQLLVEAGRLLADGDPADPDGSRLTPRELVAWLAYRMYPASEVAGVLHRLGADQ